MASFRRAVPTTTTEPTRAATRSDRGDRDDVTRYPGAYSLTEIQPISEKNQFVLEAHYPEDEDCIILSAKFKHGGYFKYDSGASKSPEVFRDTSHLLMEDVQPRDENLFALNFMGDIRRLLLEKDTNGRWQVRSRKIKFRFFHRLALTCIMFVIHLYNKRGYTQEEKIRFEFSSDTDQILHPVQGHLYRPSDKILEQTQKILTPSIDLFSFEFFENFELSYALSVEVFTRDGSSIEQHYHGFSEPIEPQISYARDFNILITRRRFPSLVEYNMFKQIENDCILNPLHDAYHSFTTKYDLATVKDFYSHQFEPGLIAWLLLIMEQTYMRKKLRYSPKKPGNRMKSLGVTLECRLFPFAGSKTVYTDIPMILMRSLSLQCHLSGYDKRLVYPFNGWIESLNCLYLENCFLTAPVHAGIRRVNMLLIRHGSSDLEMLDKMVELLENEDFQIQHMLFCVFQRRSPYVNYIDSPVESLDDLRVLRARFRELVYQRKQIVHFMHVNKNYAKPFSITEPYSTWADDKINGAYYLSMVKKCEARMDAMRISDKNLGTFLSKIKDDAIKTCHNGKYMNDRIYGPESGANRPPTQIINIEWINERLERTLIDDQRIGDVTRSPWKNIADLDITPDDEHSVTSFRTLFGNLVYDHYVKFVHDTKNPLILPNYVMQLEYVDQSIESYRNRDGKEAYGGRFEPIVDLKWWVHIPEDDDEEEWDAERAVPGKDPPEGMMTVLKPPTIQDKVNGLIDSILHSNYFFELYLRQISEDDPHAHQFRRRPYEHVKSMFEEWTQRETVVSYLAYLEQMVFSVDLTLKFRKDLLLQINAFGEIEEYFHFRNHFPK